ncbi:cell filamentation protein Fic [Rathayibacter rathayi]|uniref:Fic family protein n=1 Tax=Rathayibacter rathayi TaxID=33887 RepID=UPI000CE77900|nr:Fic family protein [Rathayibacter rathayi]PPG87997.1 cell filamentation protein Fic [Rathayibacter rathayi]PPG96095.1 cell filamentation protein Fic [Rathayibacter rathayi]
MTIEPGYGETPLEPDEADALTPQAREIFGGRPMKVELYEAEQAVSVEVGTAFLEDVVAGRLVLADLLSDVFVRTLHRALYGDLWTWAGRYRTRDLNIGVEPAHIAVEFRGSLETIRYRWENTDDWTPRELGIVVHAEAVRVHCFVDGNGRATRLLADLVFLAAQDAEADVETYDWAVDKRQYIALLRDYDMSRDPRLLAEFVPIRRVDEAEAL